MINVETISWQQAHQRFLIVYLAFRSARVLSRGLFRNIKFNCTTVYLYQWAIFEQVSRLHLPVLYLVFMQFKVGRSITTNPGPILLVKIQSWTVNVEFYNEMYYRHPGFPKPYMLLNCYQGHILKIVKFIEHLK